MQRIKNRLNLTASMAKKHDNLRKKEKENLLCNRTQVVRTISKNATTWAIANNVTVWHFMNVWRNCEENEK
jgi:hypothetical protein